MKRSSSIFLQFVIVVVGIAALAFMLWEPHIEGRNTHATLFQIYFNDPFLAYAYVASTLFFTALYQAFRLLGYIGRNEVFSERSVEALRTIKHCAVALVVSIVAPLLYLFIARPGDDIAGGIFISLLMIAVFGTSASVATMFERILQKAVDLKSENDLTV